MPYDDPRIKRTNRLHTIYRIAKKAVEQYLPRGGSYNIGQGSAYNAVDADDDDVASEVDITDTAPVVVTGDAATGYNIALDDTGDEGDVMTLQSGVWGPAAPSGACYLQRVGTILSPATSGDYIAADAFEVDNHIQFDGVTEPSLPASGYAWLIARTSDGRPVWLDSIVDNASHALAYADEIPDSHDDLTGQYLDLDTSSSPGAPSTGHIRQFGYAETPTGRADSLAYIDEHDMIRSFIGKVYSSITDDTCANSSSEEVIGAYTFLDNTLINGRVVRITARGVMGTKMSANGTLTMRMRWGGVSGTVCGVTAAGTPSSGLLTNGWEVQFTFTARVCSTVSTCTVDGQGYFEYSSSPILSARWMMANSSVLTLDNSTDKDLVLTAQWQTSDATNTIKCTQFIVEVLG